MVAFTPPPCAGRPPLRAWDGRRPGGRPVGRI
jgi:hypothetical protein